MLTWVVTTRPLYVLKYDSFQEKTSTEISIVISWSMRESEVTGNVAMFLLNVLVSNVSSAVNSSTKV